MARPPKSPESLMNSSVKVMMTDDQKRLIQDAASLDGSELSDWVRRVLIRAANDRLRRSGNVETKRGAGPAG